MTVYVDIQTSLPLTEATLFIMLSLAPGPRHGYAIMKDVQALSEDRVLLSTSTLYGALKRLLEQRWIVRVKDDNQDESGRPRKSYALTELGRRVLEAETERLDSLASVARLRTAGEQA
jgi:DNA-binding PadR family transcriptional regulator